MIYLLSDLHADINFRGFSEYLEKANEDDLLIILGDICLNFEDTDENRKFTEFFLSADKRIAMLDGNHENFEYLKSFPKDSWCGDEVFRLTENIVLLKRGGIYDICGKTFFAFGGCKSSSVWKEKGLWFPGEEPEPCELEYAYENFKRFGYKCDYILTHKYEQRPFRGIVSEPLLELTDFIEQKVSYSQWYCGHYHCEERFDEKHFYVYDNLITL